MKSIISGFVEKVKKRFGKIDDMDQLLKAAARPIADILADLNTGDGTDWREASGYYTLQSCALEPLKKPNPVSLLPSGMVLKAFVNNRTGEIRLYLAKVLDVPDREALW